MSVHYRAGKDYYYNFLCAKEKKRAKKRDNHQCRICHSEEQLQIHHVIPLLMIRFDYEIKYFNSQFNFVSLCQSCHTKLHLGQVSHPEYLKHRCDIEDLMRRHKIGTKARLDSKLK